MKNSAQVEAAAAYLVELVRRGVSHVELFRLCAERFPKMKKADFMLACEIAMLDVDE